MNRSDFTAETKRRAWARSGGRCEARGKIYGLKPRQRCNADLARGVEYDHVDPDANSRDRSLENCAAVCPPCHRWKTSHRDRPLIAKTNHQADMRRGIRARAFRPVPSSRKFRFKKRMDGRVEMR